MRTIDITTTQNVTITYELAGLKERIPAFIIDLLIVWASYLVVVIAMASTPFLEEVLDALGMRLVVIFLPIALLILYHFLFEVLGGGQSLGKRVIGIKVVRLDGQEPSLIDYLLRAVFLMIDYFFSLGILAAIFISSSAKRQRLGDMTAHTTVIRIKFNTRFNLEDILKINTREDYEPVYPEVRQFSEKDMLFIKSLIARYLRHNNLAHQKAIDELAVQVCSRLQIQDVPKNKIAFLKTLIRDYIVLTR